MAAAANLESYITMHQLDENIAERLRRLTIRELSLVTQRDLSDARNASAMLNMRCNRFEKAKPAPVQPATQLCQVCEMPAPRRSRADKRRAHRSNQQARLDRFLDSVLNPEGPTADAELVSAGLLNMRRALKATGTPSAGQLDWHRMDATCDPFRVAPRLANTSCGKRKRESVEAFAWLLETVLLPRVRATQRLEAPSAPPTIVDAGCSTGSLLLPLAHAFPEAKFVGVDVKASSLALLQERAAAAGLSGRVTTWEGRIEEYDGECDALISLHACGGASDAALQLASRYAPAGKRAVPFAVSPCCVGALPFGISSLGGKKAGSGARGAASPWLGSQLERAAIAEINEISEDTAAPPDGARVTQIATEIFALLAASAGSDGSALHEGGGGECALRRRRSKRVVEIDRLAAMPGKGLGGAMMMIAGEATISSTSLTDVLVGPPEALHEAAAREVCIL